MNQVNLDPPIIKSVEDIVRVLAVLDPKNKANSPDTADELSAVDLPGTIEGSQEPHRFWVKAKVHGLTPRDMLLNALHALMQKRQLAESMSDTMLAEINGKPMRRLNVIQTDQTLPIDSVIHRMLGGRREGTEVVWDLGDDFTYRYNVFQHQLTRRKKDASPE